MSPIPIREMVPGGPRKVAALALRVRSGLGWLFQRRSQPTSVKAAEAPIASAQRPPAQTADAFIDIVKMGRTELQDAVPMTVGQRKSPSCSTQ